MTQPFIHPNAIVDSDQIGEGTRIWAFAHVLRGACVGRNCNIADRVFVEEGAHIGDNVTVKNNVCVWNGITIEDDVFVGPNVTFTNDRYPRSPRMEAARDRYSRLDNWLARTTVRQGCSIGAAATVLPGLELGAYSVIAAGAVVTHSVAPYALVLGAPAREFDCVCRCGRPLGGSFREVECPACGETPEQRMELLEAPGC